MRCVDSMFRLLNGAMALLFLFGAAVQYNDPDPLQWVAIYVAAAIACVLAMFNRLRWWIAAVVGTLALIWAITFVPVTFPNVRIAELFGAWEMANARVEEGREMYGLLIIAVYMAVLAVATRRRRATTHVPVS